MFKAKRTLQIFNLMIFILFIFIFTFKKDVYAAAVINRLSGLNRYETALAIAKAGWTVSDNVVLATGENFPDSLCATPLSKQLNAPILLTTKSKLDKNLLDEIKSLKVKNVYIIGGEGVISKDIADNLEALASVNVIRLYGQDRFKTSVAIADYMYKNYSLSNEIVAATGYNFPDALSIAPIAAKLNMPILLTSKDQIPENMDTFLTSHNIKKTFIIGGPAIISDYVKSCFPNPERIYGNNRYTTNICIINRFRPVLDFTSISLATGQNFPDALSGAALSAKKSSPLFLTSILPDQVTIKGLYGYFNYSNITSSLVVFGGESVVPLNIINIIKTASFTESSKITLGTPTDTVYKILGHPAQYDLVGDEYILYYNTCTVITSFSERKVIGWQTASDYDTHFQLGVLDKNAPPITLGSSKEEVAAALGTPYAIDKYSDYSYLRYYYDSIVKISNDGRVIGWNNKGNLKISMGEKNPFAPMVEMGSDIYDIVEAMGTPEVIDGGVYFNNYWKYDSIYIGVNDQGEVIGIHHDN